MVQQVQRRNRVIVNDVGPRDGLQNQSKILTPAERVQLVTALLAAGMDHVEVGAFVSPKAVPTMAGTDEVLAGLPNTGDEVLTVLIPNLPTSGAMNWPPPRVRKACAWCCTVATAWRRPMSK